MYFSLQRRWSSGDQATQPSDGTGPPAGTPWHRTNPPTITSHLLTRHGWRWRVLLSLCGCETLRDKFPRIRRWRVVEATVQPPREIKVTVGQNCRRVGRRRRRRGGVGQQEEELWGIALLNPLSTMTSHRTQGG